MQRIKREHILNKMSAKNFLLFCVPEENWKYTFVVDDYIKEMVQEVENKLYTSNNTLNDVTENMLRESAEMFIYLRKAKQIVII